MRRSSVLSLPLQQGFPDSDINCLKSGLFHLTGQPYSQKGRAVKVKDGIISETKFLATNSVVQYKSSLKIQIRNKMKNAGFNHTKKVI
jgi:hypothetical protein